MIKLATSTEAKRSLNALSVLSGKTAEPPDPRKKPTRKELQIQAALFEWAEIASAKHPELRLMFHIPNEGKRNAVTGYRLKTAGMKAGLPDICLPVARSGRHGLFLELKAEGGRLQDNQKEWIDELGRQGYRAAVAFGFDEARAMIEDYLGGTR